MDLNEKVRRRLGTDLPRLAAVHGVPGISVAVLVDGQVVEGVCGVVNLRSGVDVTPDALFMIQSVTKAWTATLIMQLVDDGLVALDAPVRTYLPGFRTADEAVSAGITVRHLLTHSGGFEGDIWTATTCGDDALKRFVEDLVSLAPQHARPGEIYSYCGAGYGVLGRLVEVFREMPYASALRSYLADPLGIEEIAFCADEALAFRTAIGHGPLGPDEDLQPLTSWALLPESNPAAGNQLAMSARGLMTFARMHLSDGLAPDGTQLLSATSARTMRERQLDHPAGIESNSGHGLGWMLTRTPPLVEHSGEAPGVSASLRMVPERGVAVVMLANGGAPGPLARDLLDPLVHELTGTEPAPQLPPPSPDARVAEPGLYVGRYQTRQSCYDVSNDDDGLLRVAVSKRHEGLAMTQAAGLPVRTERYELRPVNSRVFVMVEPGGATSGAIEFIRSEDTDQTWLYHSGRAAPKTDGPREHTDL